MKYSLLFAVVLAGASRAAIGQTPVLAGDREASAALAQIVETTRARGLPVEPILAQTHRAINMHAQPGRIVAIARDMAARLEIAREALAPHPIANDIMQGEAALAYKVPPDVLTAVRKASPPDSSVAVPLGALAQLVASGVSVQRASEIVTSFIRRGASGQQLASLSNDVNSNLQLGGRLDDALSVSMRALSAVLAPAAPGQQATDVGTALAAPAPFKPKRP